MSHLLCICRSVPNGSPKKPKTNSNGQKSGGCEIMPKNQSMGSTSYGTTTLRVNPVNKQSASEIAQRTNIGLVTCTTCCPLFHRLVVRHS